MTSSRPRTPSDAELVQLHDRLWNDPRRRDDRTRFFECDSCGRAVRWIANLASVHGSSLQVVAQPIATAATYDERAHAGLVAVYVDRTGFTVPRGTTRDELDGALLYRCHWDVCVDARRMRDRISADRRRRDDAGHEAHEPVDEDAMRRYAAWRDSRGHV